MVKIGLVAPFEGRYRALGYEVLHAVRLAVQERNASGGVAGSMVELVALNDNDDPLRSAFQADKFDVDPDIVGVIGPFSSAALEATAPSYSDSGLGMITPDTCPPSVAGLDGVFCLGAPPSEIAAEMSARLPPDAQVVLVRGEGGALSSALAPLAHEVIDLSSGQVPGQPTDVILYDGDVLAAADLLVEMRRAGLDAPLWGGPSLARRQLPQIAGGAASGACYAIAPPLHADLASGSSFVEAYRAVSGAEPGPWAALAYDAAQFLLDAVERTIGAEGRVTRRGVREQVAHALGPGGQPLFVDGQRRQTGIVIYCYDAHEAYPGRAMAPASH